MLQRSASFISSSESETLEFARKLAESLTFPAHVLLFGNLGAGKTVFAKGLCIGFGVDEVDEVTSPTFTLINRYRGRVPIYHVDLYRIEEGKLEGLGLDEIFDDTAAAVIVEWAERLGDFKAPGGIEVFLTYLDEERRRIELCQLPVASGQ